MRVGLCLGVIALTAVACNSPRPGSPAAGTRAEPVTRGKPAPAAVESPATEPVTRPAPAGAEAECVLTLGAPDFVLDCSFPRCPRDLVAHLLTADTISLSRTGEVWLLDSSRKEPPFSPAGRTVLNTYAEHAEVHVPGIPTASCPLPPATATKLGSATAIEVTQIQVRRTLKR